MRSTILALAVVLLAIACGKALQGYAVVTDASGVQVEITLDSDSQMTIKEAKAKARLGLK
jgi:hypothetical protein